MHVLFRTDMKPTDELRAFYHAVVVLEALEALNAPGALASPTHARATASASLAHQDVVESAYARMCADFSFFYQQLQTSGWRTHMFLLNTSSWRIKLSDDA